MRADDSTCRLCQGGARRVFDKEVLGRRRVAYYLCRQCDLLQTETPDWLEEAYETSLASLDTGALERNALCRRTVLMLAPLLGITAGSPCLDYGGGHGVFVRMMRDAGMNFFLQDLYAENVFAQGFEGDPSNHHELVTAFEVLEHLVDVRAELGRIFAARPRFVLAGTLLHGAPDPAWHYLAPETGQHVSFFSGRTMEFVGSAYGYRALWTEASGLTLFVEGGESFPAWKAWSTRAIMLGHAVWPRAAGALRRRAGRPSRSWSDHLQLRDALRREPRAEARRGREGA